MAPIPTRAAGLERLAAFLPRAGADYARRRNADLPGHPHVSGLSPWLRRRMVTEAEVLRAVMAEHGPEAAGKFIDEVFWRSYWKVWLERNPEVWARALAEEQEARAARHRDIRAAEEGRTGIDAFDHWARDLVATGYLHNHARMWFASIWIFTLGLPWAAGAGFFLRHLLDGDPASNTLSWRWVAGLHTAGKTYLARPDNIEAFTGGRFRPRGLATRALPLTEAPLSPPRMLPPGDPVPADWQGAGLVVTEEDLSPGWLGAGAAPVARLAPLPGRADAVTDWEAAALADAAAGAAELDGLSDLVRWARDHGVTRIVTPHAPVGPRADWWSERRGDLSRAGLTLVQPIRGFDRRAWPHATHGFFRFRTAIPGLLAALDRPDRKT
jgi:deoxyribodipyrimidine photo-lyase